MQSTCPKCGAKVEVDDSQTGKMARCGNCTNWFPVLRTTSDSRADSGFSPTSSSASRPGIDHHAATGPIPPSTAPEDTGPHEQKLSIRKPKEEHSQCPRCHSELSPNAAFCASCGFSLRQTEKQSAAARRTKRLKIGLLLAAFAVVVFFGWLQSGKDGGRAPTSSPAPVESKSESSGPSVHPTKVDLPAFRPEELEAVARLPTEDPVSDTNQVLTSKGSLVLSSRLLEAVLPKGPAHDRLQPNEPPKLAANLRPISVRFTWRQDTIDEPAKLDTGSLVVNTDAGPGVLYGVELPEYFSFSGWQPQTGTNAAATILETTQWVTRRISDFTTEMLASGRLLVRPHYHRWFENVFFLTDREDLTAVYIVNHFLNPSTGQLETEQSSVFCPHPQLVVHLAIPRSSHWVRLRMGGELPLFLPLDALRTIPTSPQPDPLLFINATIEKARMLLAGSATEEILAGAQLLIEAGNLDVEKKVRAASFTTWEDSVRQLIAHPTPECQVAGVEVILQSHHVDGKLRSKLLTEALQQDSRDVRFRLAQLLSEKPSFASSQEAIQILQGLATDPEVAIRTAAYASHCQLVVQASENVFDGQIAFIHKGMRDPAPSVRAAVIGLLPRLQARNPKTALPRLSRLLGEVRLHLFEKNEAVREQAAQTILSIRSPTSVSVVTHAVQQSPDTADLFARACLDLPVGILRDAPMQFPALGEIQVQAALLPRLAFLLKQPEPRTRQAVTRLLGALPMPVASDLLAVAVTNSDLGVRLCAWSSLNAVGTSEPVPVPILVRGLNDPEERIRRVALGLMEPIFQNESILPDFVSEVSATVTSPAIRMAIVQTLAAPAVSNAPALLAVSQFLEDEDEQVWRTALRPWTLTRIRFTWPELRPLWERLAKHPAAARRVAAFYLMRLASAESSESEMTREAGLPPEAIAEATRLLSDAEPLIREAALLFVLPHREPENLEAIQRVLTDPGSAFSPNGRNHVLLALATPVAPETLRVVDRIQPTTEEDRQKERGALEALAARPAPAGPQSINAPRPVFFPISNRVLVPTSSDSGTFLLTQWATSSNPSAEAAAGYLLQVAQRLLNRAWILPSERIRLAQALHRLAEVRSISANARATLRQFETRFPRGLAAKTLPAARTEGVTDSLDSLVQFLAPKKKPVVIATYKNPVGVLIDIWFGADETPPEIYPPDARAAGMDLMATWRFLSKLGGSRVEDMDRETLARLEWVSANAPQEKLREALRQLEQVEGELGPLSRRLALEGLLLLAEQGDKESLAEALKLGWREL